MAKRYVKQGQVQMLLQRHIEHFVFANGRQCSVRLFIELAISAMGAPLGRGDVMAAGDQRHKSIDKIEAHCLRSMVVVPQPIG